MPRQFLTFSSAEAELTLEGIIDRPNGPGPFPGVVLCHPHPLHGGSMRNNVLLGACQALEAAGIMTLRFNFRGVGSSRGSHSGGPGEEADARGALAHIVTLPGIDRERIGLAGYSFGARTAMAVAAQEKDLRGVALISATGQALTSDSPLASSTLPKLLVCGDRDTNVDVPKLNAFFEGLPGPKELRIVPGADHFWWGVESEAAKPVAAFFTSVFG